MGLTFETYYTKLFLTIPLLYQQKEGLHGFSFSNGNPSVPGNHRSGSGAMLACLGTGVRSYEKGQMIYRAGGSDFLAWDHAVRQRTH